MSPRPFGAGLRVRAQGPRLQLSASLGNLCEESYRDSAYFSDLWTTEPEPPWAPREKHGGVRFPGREA